MATHAQRPASNEYAPYFQAYISLVPESDIVDVLTRQLYETSEFLRSIPRERAGFRYAPEKWSIREVIGHLIDAERVFAFRALCFARADSVQLPGFDENAYVRNASFDQQSLGELIEEFGLLRQANLSFFNHLDPKAWERAGTANSNRVSVRALAYIMAGHVRHHVSVLRERYL